MKTITVLVAAATVLLLSPHAIGDLRLPQQRKIPPTLLHHAVKKHHTRTTVPAIARLLGVRVGYNGQDALTHQFGDGLHVVGGHPGGRQLWFTRKPSGCIETDGFSYNDEGLVLESLFWGLDPATDPKIPFVRHLSRHPGWLGVVNLDMTKAQVSRLTARRLPAPLKKRDVWTWKAKGFVRANPFNPDTFTLWTARLRFHNERLVSIDLDCAEE